MTTIRNIAATAHSLQSSYSPWSKSRHESDRALIGESKDGYAFHTSYEDKPWFIIFLDEPTPLFKINIFYRKHCFIDLKLLELNISVDGINFTRIDSIECISNDDGFISFNLSYKIARFIHIRLKCKGFLYFRQVEILYDDDSTAFNNIVLKRNKNVSNNVWMSILSQSYEMNEINTVLETLSKTDVVLELGASLGAMSSSVLKQVNPKMYICIEANIDMVNLLRENHRINEVSCEILHGAVTLKSEEFKDFYINSDSWSSSLNFFKNYTRVDKIRMFNFNDILNKYKPSYLICDIEGGEYEIFNNETCFDSISKICIELHQDLNSDSTKNLLKIFENNNFSCQRINNSNVFYLIKSL